MTIDNNKPNSQNPYVAGTPEFELYSKVLSAENWIYFNTKHILSLEEEIEDYRKQNDYNEKIINTFKTAVKTLTKENNV